MVESDQGPPAFVRYLRPPPAPLVQKASEYVPPKPSQTPDGLKNWGTRVIDVPMG